MVSIVDIDRLGHDDAEGEDEATCTEEPTTEDDDRETVDTKVLREKARTTGALVTRARAAARRGMVDLTR